MWRDLTLRSPAVRMLPFLLLLLTVTEDGHAHRVLGMKKNGSCQCEVNSTMWSFPALDYEAVLLQVQTCEGSLNSLDEQLLLSTSRIPQVQAQLANVTARLQPFQYLHRQGLYTALSLRQLGQDLTQLETDLSAIHTQLNNAQTQKLSKEVEKLRKVVERMQVSDIINIKSVKENLRYLKNSVESCKTIPKDFRGQHMYCYKGLITNISEPVTTKISPFGKSYISGSWGRQAQMDTEGEKDSYWVQPLTNNHISGNTFRVYQSYEDFMAAVDHRDYTFAPSNTHTNAIEGPSGVLYGEALYYHCYRSADICRYDLKTNSVKRVTLPGTGVGFNNKFPYCYYDCRTNSDVDVEVDETGLWALYATVGNHGNLVVSRLAWDGEAETLNVTQTWETRLFKKAVSNAFMVCGVLYATRYVDDYKEEVFYAFDTATGKEDNSLTLPLEKVAKGVASLSYNPISRQLYMYNDGYLMAYQTLF
ncbi:PREDICTED: olfactomedin-4-like [Cyprinodon variegatus]|uniref:Si:ch211-194m7.4 n=1 Tax=Cyprinodon variegatus TaxID=28743 RepID=A0A3Q2DZM9_CYPVA|nr:PREDICTED: olfactomedin-4-like [Cyprinodon variegatus]